MKALVKTIEKNYGRAARGIMATVNPVKKIIIKTYCDVHKYINIRSIEIINQQGCEEKSDFFMKHINELNSGVMWADQDFKSTNHFYHFSEEKGLYGFSNALVECKKYYNMAVNYASAGDICSSVFYFGAACHLVQDSTVPQHVNNKLLKNHRKFELWIRKKLAQGYAFDKAAEIKRYPELDDYIKKNAVIANNIYLSYCNILDVEMRYSKIANAIIAEAEKTTAGLMLDFYSELVRK